MFLRQLKALLFACTISLPAQAALNHDPSLQWKTLTSPHFMLHFHDGEQALAEDTIAIAERVHQRLSPRIGWTPRQKTQLVLTDRYDFTNGWATVFPYNQVTLITLPPDDLFGLEDFDHWMDMLITHEYTHVLHLDKASKGPGSLRHVLGRFPLTFPAAFQPSWVLEGLATHVETDEQRGIGRGQSSLYRAMMRMEVVNGIKPLRQINQPMVSWPGGQTPYLYGVYFYRFIEHRYGADRARQWVDHYSMNLIPFMINTNSRRVFGKDLDALWAEFNDYLKQQFDPELQRIRLTGLTPATALSRSGYQTGNARSTPDGTVYFIQDNQYREDQLIQLRPNQPTARAIADVRSRSFDLHPQAGIVLAQLDLNRNSNYYSDLYHIDPASGRTTQLTHGGRYRHVSWSPDGSQLIASQFRLGRFSLHRLDTTGKPLETLWQAGDDTILGALDWSPKCDSLIASVWRNGQWELEQFDLAQKQWRALTQSAEIEAQPQFDASGESVVFTADYGRVFNIYRLDLASGQLSRLTNELGAATQPALSTDGNQLYYSALGTSGYNIQRSDVQPTADTAPAMHAAPTTTGHITPANYPASNYRGLKNLTPTWWFPYWFVDKLRSDVGITTSGNDPLFRHNYSISAAYDSTNNWGTGALFYTYDRWQPIFKLYAARTAEAYTYHNGELNRFRFDDHLQAELEYPFLKYLRQWAIHGGLVIQETRDAKLGAGAVPWLDTIDHVAGVALSYNSTRRYPQGISPAYGRQINLVNEHSGWGNGNYDGSVRRLDWQELIGLGGRNVLGLRVNAGWGEDESRNFKLGGIYPGSLALPGTPYQQPLFNRRSFPLRGYSDGVSYGRRMAVGSVEWRFPITLVERGLMAPPIGVHQVSGKVFYDIGNTWMIGNQPDQWLRGAGLELNTLLVLGYRMGLQLDVGYAHGFDLGGQDQLYLRLGAGF